MGPIVKTGMILSHKTENLAFSFLHNREAWVRYWYWFNICCCQSFGSVPLEIPLVLPLWFPDGRRELQNNIITLSKGITWNLSFSAPTPYQEEKHLPEAPDQTPLYFVGRNWNMWALLAQRKTEKASIWPVEQCQWASASQRDRVLRSQLVCVWLMALQSISVYSLKGKTRLHFPILSKQNDLLLKYINKIKKNRASMIFTTSAYSL